VLSDRAYVARVKRHYAMFREDVEQGNRPGPDGRSTKIGRNDPCPCGSGRKYKKCCFETGRDPRERVPSAASSADAAGDDLRRDRLRSEVIPAAELSISGEIAYVVDRARAHSARFVRLGQLALFSTSTGDAWLLEPPEGLALPLARAGERLPAGVEETEQRFVIE
jgi:hypothetical protein